MPTVRAAKTKIELKPYSDKQKMLATWWMPGLSPYADCDVLIADGAVRSGKTMVGSASYIMWAMYNFNHQNFAIVGKSLDSIRRNLWLPLQQWLIDIGISVLRLKETSNGYILKYSYIKDSKKYKIENYIYLFGGKDEGAAAYIQGITLAGLFSDETTLLPESFINQAVARCSVENSKMWFNCNPEGPFHWFKAKWVDKAQEKNALRIHFIMDDNPSLSKKTLDRYKRSWDGVFYQRFVLGEWASAEGSIYSTFATNHKRFLIENPKQWLRENNQRLCALYIGVDWGHNGSANVIVATGLTDSYEHVLILKEMYTKELLDPEQLYKKHISFIDQISQEYNMIPTIYADNAEMMLVRGLKNASIRAGLNASVQPCVKYEIIDRIAVENTLFAQDRIKISSGCTHMIDALNTATWQPKEIGKVQKDIRLDNGSSNIDSLDAFEYSICGRMRQLNVDYTKFRHKS